MSDTIYLVILTTLVREMDDGHEVFMPKSFRVEMNSFDDVLALAHCCAENVEMQVWQSLNSKCDDRLQSIWKEKFGVVEVPDGK